MADAVIVTTCWGAPYWAALPSWLEHVKALTSLPIEVITIDPPPHTVGGADVVHMSVTDQRIPAAASTWLLRLEHIIRHLEADRAALQLDMDVLLRRDPAPLFSLPYDFIISRAFGSPPAIVEKYGFVGCCGFYIAKQASVDFCRACVRATYQNRYGTYLDQSVLNHILGEGQPPTQQAAMLGDVMMIMDVFQSHGCSVAVLPKHAVAREPAREPAIFANHFTTILNQFVDKTPPANL